METYKVVITARSFGKEDSSIYRYLEREGCRCVKLEGEEGLSEERIKKELQDADALIAGLEPVGRKLIEGARRLRVISRYGVGYENVDCTAAKERGIQVTVTPGANGESVADLAVALMLSAARNIPLMDSSLHRFARERPQGMEMYKKTLGIIGTGRIGKGVARRCLGFSMKLLAYDMYPDTGFAADTGAEYVDLNTLLEQSDFITVHTPLTQKTENLISDTEFERMKKTAVLVNTARGGIVNEDSLYKALREGKIFGAALDTSAQAESGESLLLGCPNCILTPHAGAATREASARMSRMAAENVLEVLGGGQSRFNVAL